MGFFGTYLIFREFTLQALEVATEAGDTEEIDKQSKRLVKVSKNHVSEAQQLLTLMGIPWINVGFIHEI